MIFLHCSIETCFNSGMFYLFKSHVSHTFKRKNVLTISLCAVLFILYVNITIIFQMLVYISAVCPTGFMSGQVCPDPPLPDECTNDTDCGHSMVCCLTGCDRRVCKPINKIKESRAMK